MTQLMLSFHDPIDKIKVLFFFLDHTSSCFIHNVSDYRTKQVVNRVSLTVLLQYTVGVAYKRCASILNKIF